MICQDAEIVQVGHVSLDGTKIKVNASKHKAMSYERMQKEEERLIQEIAEMSAEAEKIDQAEDKLYGKNNGATNFLKPCVVEKTTLPPFVKPKKRSKKGPPGNVRKKIKITTIISHPSPREKTNTISPTRNPGLCPHPRTKNVLFRHIMPNWRWIQKIKLS